MTNEQIEDLKQFIDIRVSQIVDLRVTQSEEKFEIKLDELRQEMRDGFAGVGEAFEEMNKYIDERFSKLEKSAAL